MRKTKRVLSFILALAMAILCIPVTGLTALAGDIQSAQTAYVSEWAFAKKDQNLPIYNVARHGFTVAEQNGLIRKSDGISLCMMYVIADGYRNDPYGASDWNTIASNRVAKDNSGKGLWVYCIEEGTPHDEDVPKTAQALSDSAGNVWKNYSSNKRKGMELATIAGFPSTNCGGYPGCDAYAATQAVIWEFALGQRKLISTYPGTELTGHVDTDEYGVGHTSQAENFTGSTLAAYNWLVKQVGSLYLKPSLSGSTKLTWNSSNNRFETKLTDANKVLNYYDISVSNNISRSVNSAGTELTLYTTDGTARDATITFTHKVLSQSASSQAALVFKSVGDQEMLIGKASDPQSGTKDIEVEGYGSCNIVKESEDGTVSGISFKITGPDGYSNTATTNSQGKISLTNLLPGTYTVTETAPGRYVQPSSKTVTVKSGETASVSFSNVLKKWRVTVQKKDSATGTTAQGDGKLSGAVYGLYDSSNNELARYTTNSSGKFTTGYFQCGSGYYFKEITAPTGYKLDTAKHTISGTAASDFTNEKNDAPDMDLTEDAILGNIEITKYMEVEGGAYELEKGAKFQIYLKANGSYADSPSREKTTVTTDANGYVKTKDLPYGRYVIHQTAGNAANYFIDDFELVIKTDGTVVHSAKTLLNEGVKAYLEVVKKDAETGKTIPLPGAEFEIYKEDGTLVTTITSDENGIAQTSEELFYGNYFLKETKAPEGYVIDSEQKPFSITKDNIGEGMIGTVTYQHLKVVNPVNQVQKGVIKVFKEGFVFSHVAESEGEYTPVYETRGLQNAVFNVIAAEDIVTPEGTVRAQKDDVVATLTTDETGWAQTDELYLGRYNVVETQAPEGYVIDTTSHEANLEYAGQEVEITEQSLSITNVRQTVEFNLIKTMQQDETFGIGTNGEVTNAVFGIYAKEDIVASDETFIPKDGLVEAVHADKDGFVKVTKDLPLGTYYFKEISTDPHYQLNVSEFEVKFEYQGETVEKAIVFGNEHDPISNDLKYGVITLTKLNEDKEPLEGVVFGLYRDIDKEFENPILTVTSDKDGNVIFENVPYGSWVVREISTLEGYVLDETPYPFVIEKHEQREEQTVINSYLRVTITKADAEDPSVLLSGAVFDLFRDTNGNRELDNQDEYVESFTELEESPGTYEVKGLNYGAYFVIETMAPAGYLKDRVPYYFTVDEKTKDFSVYNDDATKLFLNQPTVVVISKTDIVDGKPLPNAGFRIKDENGNVVAEGYTDENGELVIKRLPEGKYTYEEFEAPDGYLINSEIGYFEINGEEDIVLAKMADERKTFTGHATTPDTGDETVIIPYVIMTSVSATAVILTVRKKRLRF